MPRFPQTAGNGSEPISQVIENHNAPFLRGCPSVSRRLYIHIGGRSSLCVWRQGIYRGGPQLIVAWLDV